MVFELSWKNIYTTLFNSLPNQNMLIGNSLAKFLQLKKLKGMTQHMNILMNVIF